VPCSCETFHPYNPLSLFCLQAAPRQALDLFLFQFLFRKFKKFGSLEVAHSEMNFFSSPATTHTFETRKQTKKSPFIQHASP